MNAPAKPPIKAVFTQGSTLRHVLVMTATGSVGIMALFVVDLLALLYISWLGDPGLTAGVGYAAQVSFLVFSLSIGMMIGVSAVVARAIGAGQRGVARRYAASGLMWTFVLATLTSLAALPFVGAILHALGAEGSAFEAARTVLVWTLPFINFMALGMVMSGLLRAVGDARGAMYVTLGGAVVSAVLDPLLILGLKLGVTGAALSLVAARFGWIAVGAWGAIRKHDLVAWPRVDAAMADAPAIFAIAGPAMLTNLAAPASGVFGMHVMSQFGVAAVAAMSIIDRVIPVAFGPLFAMSGVIGPIIGQNFGAGLLPRVRDTLTSCFLFSLVYVLIVWALLWLATPALIWLFDAKGATASLVAFFCAFGASAWAFLGCLFAANAAYNNLGHAMLSTAFNWGRATLGFMPFVTLGARWWGPEGVILGASAGAALFGVGSIVCAYWLTGRLVKKQAPVPKLS